ncbi:MAG: hypothetical protein ACLQO1_25805 [Steroidobacteraceae bacterium]
MKLGDVIESEFPDLSYVIGADDPEFGRIRIHFSCKILVDKLGSKKAIDNDVIEQLYRDKRREFEAVAERARALRPAKDIVIQDVDFSVTDTGNEFVG